MHLYKVDDRITKFYSLKQESAKISTKNPKINEQQLKRRNNNQTNQTHMYLTTKDNKFNKEVRIDYTHKLE